MAVHLSGRLPNGDTNGIARLAQRLHGEPEDFYGLVRFHVSKLVDNLDDEADPHSVVVAIVHVEEVGDDQAMAMLDVYAQRTGKVALPWDEIPTGDESPPEPEP